jgi:hypothetical protein
MNFSLHDVGAGLLFDTKTRVTSYNRAKCSREVFPANAEEAAFMPPFVDIDVFALFLRVGRALGTWDNGRRKNHEITPSPSGVFDHHVGTLRHDIGSLCSFRSN